jgi:hypothetical protein
MSSNRGRHKPRPINSVGINSANLYSMILKAQLPKKDGWKINGEVGYLGIGKRTNIRLENDLRLAMSLGKRRELLETPGSRMINLVLKSKT